MTPDDADSAASRTAPAFAELSGKAQERIDRACDEFEAAWQAVVTRPDQSTAPPDGWPSLARSLANLTGGERTAALRELIPIDISYRRRCGAAVTIADYASFPELDADWLSQVALNPDGETHRISFVSEPPLPLPPRANMQRLSLEVFVTRLTESGVLDRESIDRELTALQIQASAVASNGTHFVSGTALAAGHSPDNVDPEPPVASAKPLKERAIGLTPPRSPVESQNTTDELGQRLIALGLLTPFQYSSLMQTPPLQLVLGDYVILSPLGQGGMGTVYRARHQRMDRIVALKVLPRSTAHDPQVANRFRREIRAVARLSHPHIVAAHDAGEHDGVMYLVMECIDGLDLSNWVRRHGPLSVTDTVECIAQAADGMEYAHHQGIIHRDIKPSNLLMQRAEGSSRSRETSDRTLTSPATSSPATSETVQPLHIKVLDLGLARIDAEPPNLEATAVTRSGMIFGTAEYMSPEQAMNVRLADQRSDIYSLGCTLFFLLTGHPVVNGETYMEMVMAHQLLTLPSLIAERTDVPAELDQIFRRMTARKPEQRFGSMQEVREALRAIPHDRCPRSPASDALRTHVDATQIDSTTGWIAPLPSQETPENLADQVTVLTSPLAARTEQLATFAVSGERQDLSNPKRQRGRAIHDVINPKVPNPLERSPSLTLRVTYLSMLAVLIAAALIAGVWSLLGDPAKNGNITSAAPDPLGFPASEAEAQQKQRDWANHLGVKSSLRNSIGMTLMLIPPGEFTMGTTAADFETLSAQFPNAYEADPARNEIPSRRVRLEKSFWIGQTEVTVGQFRQFADDSGYVTEAEKNSGYGVVNERWILQPGFSWRNMGEQQITDDHPVGNQSWNDAVAFCDWLTRHESQEQGHAPKYRLPTEAEWEFACRAGSNSLWFFGSDPTHLPDYAFSSANSFNRLNPTATKRPNAFQLFDLYGNDSEWCSDWFAAYVPTTDPLLNPTGPKTGIDRVQRGGGFNFAADRQRSAAREGNSPESPTHGSFRIVRDD